MGVKKTAGGRPGAFRESRVSPRGPVVDARRPEASAVTKPLSRLEALIATTGPRVRLELVDAGEPRLAPGGGGTICQVDTPPRAIPHDEVRSPIRKSTR